MSIATLEISVSGCVVRSYIDDMGIQERLQAVFDLARPSHRCRFVFQVPNLGKIRYIRYPNAKHLWTGGAGDAHFWHPTRLSGDMSWDWEAK